MEINNLPLNLIKEIFSFVVDIKDIFYCSLLNKSFSKMFDENNFHKRGSFLSQKKISFPIFFFSKLLFLIYSIDHCGTSRHRILFEYECIHKILEEIQEIGMDRL
jgi:hypothetical protein